MQLLTNSTQHAYKPYHSAIMEDPRRIAQHAAGVVRSRSAIVEEQPSNNARRGITACLRYKLRVSFPDNYPVAPPSCYFLEPTPRHPHVYTNGDICLNLLGNGWRPTITVAQLSLSILSMLSSAKTKGIPQDNAVHAASAPGTSPPPPGPPSRFHQPDGGPPLEFINQRGVRL